MVETEKGTFEFETYPNEAPKTVAHIVNLVNKKFYNGQRVHRVVPGFVIQMGDPPDARHDQAGDVGQRRQRQADRRRGNHQDPHARPRRAWSRWRMPVTRRKADSQFYVTLAPQPRLDADYAVFGKVISGMDVVEKIAGARPDHQSNRARGKVGTPARSGKRSTSSAGILAVTGSSSIFRSVTALATDCAEK